MEDPILNRNLADTKELATRWSQFHDFFDMATKSDKISPDAERKFMDLKTRIAMLHDSLMQSIKHDQKVAQNVIAVMRQCLMLRTIPQMSQTEIQKIEFDWNEVYLLMVETIANIEEEVARLAGISLRAYQMQQLQNRFNNERRKFFADTRVRVALFSIVTTSVIAFFAVGIPAFGWYEYSNIKTDVPLMTGPYNGVARIVRLFDKELLFVDIAEMKTPYVDWGHMNEDDALQRERMKDDYFISQLPNYGYAAADIDEMSGLVRTKRANYKEILRDPSNKKLFIFAYLFNNTEDAVRFVQARADNLEAMTNSKRRKKIEERIVIGRRSNFIVIIDCENRLASTNYLEERWKFKKEQVIGYLKVET